MLIYHPAYDVNHCLYRMLRILESSTHEEFSWELLRLLDFYTLFPHLLKAINPLPTSLRPFKKVIKEIHDSYEALPNAKRILFDLEGIQNAAILNLMAKDMIDIELFHKKTVRRTETPIPKTLKEAVENDALVNEVWFKFVVNELPLVTFFGDNGLKARNGLMEFRYDSSTE